MKKTKTFESVPLVEVLKKAVEINGHKLVKKTAKKVDPYAAAVPSVTGK